MSHIRFSEFNNWTTKAKKIRRKVSLCLVLLLEIWGKVRKQKTVGVV